MTLPISSYSLFRFVVHYGLHFLAPLLLSAFFGKKLMFKAYLFMVSTMLIDLDHLLSCPIFDPSRLSVGFHPLHTIPAIVVYVVLCLLPYERLHWPWWLRAVGIGLVFHILTDLQDFYFW